MLDDQAPPRAVAAEVARFYRGAEDMVAVLRARGEEWTPALDRLERALPLLNDAHDMATMGWRMAQATGKDDPAWRPGASIRTFTGVWFWPLDPRPHEVVPEDIAHALAAKNRFNGHSPRAYSVGAHTLRVASICEVLARLHGLDPRLARAFGVLHDSDEAYLPDIPRPLKPYIHGWFEIEERVRRAAHDRFGLGIIPVEYQDIVDQADSLALAIEDRTLFGGALGWADRVSYNTEDTALVEAAELPEEWLGKAAVKAGLLETMRQSVPDYYVPASVAPIAPPQHQDAELLEGAWQDYIKGSGYHEQVREVQMAVRHTFVSAWVAARQGMVEQLPDPEPNEVVVPEDMRARPSWADRLPTVEEEDRSAQWRKRLEED